MKYLNQVTGRNNVCLKIIALPADLRTDKGGKVRRGSGASMVIKAKVDGKLDQKNGGWLVRNN